jgi:DNA-binding transcriptional ArsR family regulator
VATRTPPDRHDVAVGLGAASVRRLVGPAAWVVLECLAAGAVVDGDETVSHQSVRGLTDELGLAKDTVARALRRLTDEHLVAYVGRRDDGGRFGAGYYRLDLPCDVLVPLTPPPHSDAPPAGLSATRSRRASNDAQLSLIDFESPD